MSEIHDSCEHPPCKAFRALRDAVVAAMEVKDASMHFDLTVLVMGAILAHSVTGNTGPILGTALMLGIAGTAMPGGGGGGIPEPEPDKLGGRLTRDFEQQVGVSWSIPGIRAKAPTAQA